jgi:ERCC4-related helicase
MPERFERGDRVRDPLNRAKTAVIVDGPETINGHRFWEVHGSNGESMLYREDQLVKPAVDRSSPVSWLTDRPLGDPYRFGRFLTQLRLSSGLTDVFYSFSSTRTLFRAHQFKPVLKALESTVPRLLLADEVGLGKTIEAGLVWAELDARQPTRRVLIVTPTSLRHKWQVEMYRRFDREISQINRAGFLRFVDQYYERGDASRLTAISSFGQLRSDDVLDALSTRPPIFDLVIIDEAHAMRNANTRTHQLGELLAQNSTALLLLSATPVNLGSNDLFNLLRLLRPDEFTDPDLFQVLLEPNEYVNRAANVLRSTFPPNGSAVIDELRRVENTRMSRRYRDDALYQDVLARLGKDVALDRAEVARLQSDLSALNTLSHVYTRTRKRDLRDHTTVRRAVNMHVELQDHERTVYTAVTGLVATMQSHATGVAPGLAAVMPARQASSCLPVMRDYLEGLLTERRTSIEDFLEAEEDVGDGDAERAALLESQVPAIESLLRLCQSSRDVDSKFDAFLDALQKRHAGGSRKFLVFSFFRRTLTYLTNRLAQAGFECNQMNGSTPMADRDRLIGEFRYGTLEVLLCSEIGSEGLDFEFCDTVVNYDLPWNPMRLEQRIGRIDRFGQKSPTVFVVNFTIPGTIDTDIWLRLYNRIGIFERSIGELEPILGDRITELTRAIAQPGLTLTEQQQVADQIALAAENESQDIERFEQVRDQLMGADAYVADALEEARDTHRYLTPDELRRYVAGFLHDEARPARLDEASEDSGGTQALYGSPALADLIRAYTRDLMNPQLADLISNLETGGALRVTFDADVAYQHQAQFLTIRHPLLQAIARFYVENDRQMHPAGYVRVPSDRVGRWLFFLLFFNAGGLQPLRSLSVVAFEPATGKVDEEVGQEILTCLTGAGLARIPERDIPIVEPADVGTAYAAALETIDRAQTRLSDELGRRNDALITSRQEALRQSLDLNVRQLEQLAARPDLDLRIQRMRLAQARNVTLRTDSEIAKLEDQRHVAVGFKVVAGGLADFVTLS